MSLSQYLKDTRGELHHVSWPTRTQTTVYTVLVITISLLTAFYLGAFDYLFSQVLDRTLESQTGLPAPTTPDISVDTVQLEGGAEANIEITPVEVPTE